MSRPGASILVVDDVPDNLRVLSDILIREGFSPRPVTSGEMALRTIDAALPQLILADIKMPGMDGYELCRLLKATARTREIPVIFISAMGETRDKVRAFEAGGVDYITKPFQAGEVVARVRTHLAMDELRENLRELNRELEERVRLRTEELVSNVEVLREQLEERRKAEEALRESEEEFRYMFENSPVGKSITSADGKIRVNHAFAAMLGYEKAELEETRWEDLTHPDDVEASRDLVEKVLSGTAPLVRFVKRYLRRDGSVLWADVSTVLRRDGAGRPRYFLTNVVDITERKRVEDEILRLNEGLEQRVAARTAEFEAANQNLESFSYSVSHDLRAPLRAIEGFAGMLVKNASDHLTGEDQRLLEVIRTNARKMSELIDGLLAFSRTGRQEIRHSALTMKSMARSAFEEVVQGARAPKEIDFRLDELPDADGDATLIRQVWINLLANALKFSAGEEKPVVEVGGSLEGAFAVYHVRDNGVGFDPRHADKLFRVFQRLHAVTEFEGTGIGLALVKRIVERHGGRVWAESEVGKGATFFVSLPRALGPRQAKADRAEMERLTGG